MHISWLGRTGFRLQTKTAEKDITILIDPYKTKTGSAPRNLTADMVLFTRGEDDSITLSGNPFILSTAGECDVKGVLITAVEGLEPGTTMIRVDAEGMSLGHLGLSKQALGERQKDVLNGVDILCVPVGGMDGYDADAAIKAVNDLEPRVIIPMAMKSDNDPQAETPEKFLKVMGMSGLVNEEKKVILKKKDLPLEDTQVVVLGKE